MPAVKIVLKLLCQNVDDGHQCIVNLRRSVYEVDADIEEIKLPLQAIVKLKRTPPLAETYSSTMLPMSQRAQISLPVMAKFESSHDEQKTGVSAHDGRGSRRFGDQIRDQEEPIVGRTRKSIMKDRQDAPKESEVATEPAGNAPVEELKEIKAMLMELKERLHARDQPVSMDDTQEEAPMPRKSSVMMGRPSVGINEIRSSETSNCPFVQYLLHQHESPEGNIDMNLPISAIIGPGYTLAYKRDTHPSMDAGDICTPPEGAETNSSTSGYPNSASDNSTVRCNIGLTSGEEELENQAHSLIASNEDQYGSVCICPKSHSDGLSNSCDENAKEN